MNARALAELEIAPPTTDELAEDAAIARADVYLAADRPDRLELEIAASASDPPPPEPGRAIALSLRGRRVFSGLAERCGFRLARTGRASSIVAYAAYESRRRSRPEEIYYHLTDAEIAARIAGDLGLVPVVEPTHEVHERMERTGDPMRFLRDRARENGCELAVASGTLFFLREVPRLERPPLRVDPTAPLIELQVEDRGSAGRGGEMEIAGDVAWEPLRELELSGFGDAWDGRYRVVRVRHYVDPRGFRSRVDFLEESLDLRRWKSEGGGARG